MRPEFKRIHYYLAGFTFVVGFLTYLLTMQPTIPFWDCGEFAAAASALQVPHPPGAPLWTVVGRIAMLLPTFADPAARYNLFSVLSSALSILLLYLTLVRLLRMWRGNPKSAQDAIVTFGGALIGALAYCWTDSFWFNALECEVYAFGSLFISLVPWLILVWHEHADEPHNERYLLLIAFVIGLSLGVHQLALLTMFPVFMIVYYKKRKIVTLMSWLGMVGLSVAMFVLVFYVILSKLVDWAGSGNWVLSVAILVAIVGVIIYGQRKRNARVALAGWSLAMVFLGYTTYMFVMVRAAQNPPMNENAPSTFSKLSGYINRDQYGQMSIADEFTHRRLPQQRDDHGNTWNNYTSDGDFFWRYQTNWMFHRYLGWNFIGRDGDFMGAGVDFSKTWAIPFFLGLFGIYWHFKRDPKRGLTLLGAFIIMGYLVDWYQNQQDPQPRERDYFYVGAFYIFAMWVGIGAVGIMEIVKEKWADWDKRKMTFALGISAALLLILGPINQCIGLAGLASGQSFAKSSKWAEYSRKNNWVPWEYAYNILQSCDANAILFTWGDNDTFPLWCLQDSYGIRRDVRIVQLQLATMMWNAEQVAQKNDWGSEGVRLQIYTPARMQLPSDNEAYEAIQQARDWKAPFIIPVNDAQARWISGDSTAHATTMTWAPKIVNFSDFLVADIVNSNLGTRPICYSVTVPENARAGLNKFLIYEGLVARVTPFQQPEDMTGLAGSVQPVRYSEMMFQRPQQPHAEPFRGLILHSYADPTSHLSGMDEDYAMTYRYDFMRLADWDVSHADFLGARRTLDSMEALIPVHRIGMDFSFASFIADLADKAGDWPLTQKYAAYGAAKLREQMQNPDWTESNSQSHPDVQLANLEMRAGEFARARKDFEAIRGQSKPDQQGFADLKLLEVDARRLESEKKYDSAYHKYNEILQAYAPSATRGADLQDLKNRAWFDSVNMAKPR
ncbi:MAG: DUF2723 domain-containing protein [Bacteroidota bacterium]|nr:DUF2723 domain-containing protein [Bacteroidota bacterium]MDP4234570.1 DUF2723 domain-containing protein [Bacteroidota bacterium]MDP4243699.1 DUF2723 domain-containing protein [Bacteroidota bacterium]MDP4288353.1 DUF2723 domain-containing protein [Bacteroidota bacterium]